MISAATQLNEDNAIPTNIGPYPAEDLQQQTIAFDPLQRRINMTISWQQSSRLNDAQQHLTRYGRYTLIITVLNARKTASRKIRQLRGRAPLTKGWMNCRKKYFFAVRRQEHLLNGHSWFQSFIRPLFHYVLCKTVIFSYRSLPTSVKQFPNS